MTRFFLWTMRSAAMILFGLALLIAAGTIAYHLFIYLETARAIESGAMTMTPPLSVSQLALSVVTSLGGAVMPLLGAAIIWRIDTWMARHDGKSGK